MIILRGKTVAICIEKARALGLGVPDYCLKASESYWTFGYLK